MDPGKSVSEWTIPFTPHTRSLSMDNIQSYSPASGAFTPAPTAPGRHFGPLSENTPIRFMETPAPFSVSLPRTSTKRPRVISQANRDEQKMKDVLDAITGVKWTLGEFLHRLFRRNEQEVGPRRSQHSQMVSKFLTGGCDYSTSDILTSWMTSPYGSLPADSLLAADIAARSHFICSPNCWEHLVRGAERAVQASSGLHDSANSTDKSKQLKWSRIGSETISVVGDVVKFHLEAAWYLLDLIASRKARNRDGAQLPPRKSRPSKGVIIHALADLLFCRSYRANLLPLSRGILYFGSSVPVEIMAYNSRVGTMPSYSTIYRTLGGLSAEEALVTRTHGRDLDKSGVLLFDNVQNLARVRDQRIGRENHMNVGMSALWVEAGAHINVDVDQLLGFLDQKDADETGYLEWLEVLVRCIKPLNNQKPKVSACYRQHEKLVVPLHKSVVHPLAASGKKETIPSELKDGLLDFLEQIPRKLIVGGDGLSYAMVLQLQSYLQFHKDTFESLEILEPQLQVWHTKWTDLIRIFQTHWGRVSGKSINPSSLGHSAGKIGRAAPSNMKKVEFYPGSQLLYLVLDARMLDCWSLLLGTSDIITHFDMLAEANKLPDFEELVTTAKTLHRTFSAARARDHALFDIGAASAWAKTIPTGTPWVPMKGKKNPKPVPRPCKGDFVLAQAMDFLRDSINSRKTAIAVAEGNVGRLYECIKHMLFTFAGSTHTNYVGYLLETIINLELESSPGLKEALLLCLLVNISGLLGHFEEGDYVVEFFNRLLEDVVQHKNAQFDDDFIRNVVSRNLRHIAELKLAWHAGTGMAPKSKSHTDPHTNPELRILLKLYHKEELHSRRLGRQIDDRDTDDFAKGVKKLRGRALQKIIDKSLPAVPTPSMDPADGSGSESEDKSSSDESEDPDSDVEGWMDMMLGPGGGDEGDGTWGLGDESEDDMTNDEDCCRGLCGGCLILFHACECNFELFEDSQEVDVMTNHPRSLPHYCRKIRDSLVPRKIVEDGLDDDIWKELCKWCHSHVHIRRVKPDLQTEFFETQGPDLFHRLRQPLTLWYVRCGFLLLRGRRIDLRRDLRGTPTASALNKAHHRWVGDTGLAKAWLVELRVVVELVLHQHLAFGAQDLRNGSIHRNSPVLLRVRSVLGIRLRHDFESLRLAVRGDVEDGARVGSSGTSTTRVHSCLSSPMSLTSIRIMSSRRSTQKFTAFKVFEDT
ncbi:hypothetical protein B0H10DRAFT_2322822 [Mycena sp. CBHHK59/15]|nr:hypothetical protein B0H10DRAFT_2322822 [Mycena sp. CBHHK59/15]